MHMGPHRGRGRPGRGENKGAGEGERHKPASRALIAVCWKGSTWKGNSLAGVPARGRGGALDGSSPLSYASGGWNTWCVHDLPLHSTRLVGTTTPDGGALCRFSGSAAAGGDSCLFSPGIERDCSPQLASAPINGTTRTRTGAHATENQVCSAVMRLSPSGKQRDISCSALLPNNLGT